MALKFETKILKITLQSFTLLEHHKFINPLAQLLNGKNTKYGICTVKNIYKYL